MDVIDILEERVMHMVSRLKALEEENAALKTAAEQENASLKEALAQERQNKDAVLSRVDQLLKKLQEPSI
jgi:vacuolar-type H+-ATPase subunit I/STV1